MLSTAKSANVGFLQTRSAIICPTHKPC